MEILSQTANRADSGAGVRQRAGQSFGGHSRFDNILSAAIEEARPTITEKRPVKEDADGNPASIILDNEKNDEALNAESTLTAGAMGIPTDVVNILEVDKESATTPETPAQPYAEQTDAAAHRQNALTDAAGKTKATYAQADPDANNAAQTAQAADAKNASESKREAGAMAANMEQAVKTDTANVDNNTGATAGEVSARMPKIMTSERQGEKDGKSDFSEKGNLSHLENENDAAKVKGQAEKTYSETANAVRNAAEGAQENANQNANQAPPLTDGIKPEQFRAEQLMKQATLDAPVKADNLFDEMVSRLESMKTESRSTMTIQLKPEFLGKVALEIAIDAAGLHVKINAADAGVRGMINGQITALIESLENKGIEVAEVEVAYTGVDNGAFKENREGHNSQANRNRRTTNEVRPADGVSYYTALPIDTLEYYLDAGVSSVEYTA